MSLSKIQSELKAPKGQYNKFGKYHYRSCEDIVEAAKGVLSKYDAYMTISDEMIEVAGRVYVKATVSLFIPETPVIIVSACARESLDRKGMDDAQITGATSSYARKYALNGMFAIDDTKDSDTEEVKLQEAAEPVVTFITAKQLLELQAIIDLTGSDAEGFCKFAKITSLKQMPANKFDASMAKLREKLPK